MSDYTPTGKPFKKPLKFKTVEELTKGIDNYFASLYDYARDMWGNRLKDKDYKPPKDGSDDDNPHAGFVMKKVKVATVTGLAVALDTTRETLLDYERGKYDDRDPETGDPIELDEQQREWNAQVAKYSDTIKRAKQMILEDTEQQLYKPGRATGAIFSLKVNYEWQDKNVTELHDPDGVLDPFAGLSTEELRQIAKGGK
jgi:hypothetical protein